MNYGSAQDTDCISLQHRNGLAKQLRLGSFSATVQPLTLRLCHAFVLMQCERGRNSAMSLQGVSFYRMARSKSSGDRVAVALRSVTLFVISLSVGSAGAAPSVESPGQRPAYTVIDQDLRDLLTEVGGQLGLRVSISDTLHGRVHGRLPDQSPRAIIEHLATVYAFDWYIGGNVLYISPTMDTTTKILDLGHVSVAELRTAMESFGLNDARWPLRLAGETGLAAISGPPSYCTSAEQILAALAKREPSATRDAHPAGVVLFRGTTSRLH